MINSIVKAKYGKKLQEFYLKSFNGDIKKKANIFYKEDSLLFFRFDWKRNPWWCFLAGFVKLLWLFPTLEGWSHESESRTCWHQSHKIKSLGKPDIENYTDLLLLQLLMLVRPQCRWPILWMEISEDVPGIHKHKQECCLSHGHMNNDESTPAGECGLLQPMKEEPAIIDSQDSSVGQDIMGQLLTQRLIPCKAWI